MSALRRTVIVTIEADDYPTMEAVEEDLLEFCSNRASWLDCTVNTDITIDALATRTRLNSIFR